MIKQTYFDYIYYLILLIVSFLFIVIFSSVSSPFTIDYSADSSIFMAMGKMFLNGKIPYVDFFDHKGPSLVLLQAVGQLFGAYRPGIFILETVNLFITLLLIYKIGKLVLDSRLAISICFFVLFFLSRFFNKGNTTEELSLVPLFLVLFYTCKMFFEKIEVSPKTAFVIGLCFSFLFWLRVNNAGAIVACCIFLFLWTIFNKDYKSLKNLLLYFALGQIPFTLCYLAYFGYHGGVYEMIYATFLFNFLYVESLFNFSSAYTWVNYFIGFGLLAGSILYYIKRKDWTVFVFSFILFCLTLITTNVGPAYNHYFILAVPAVVLAFVLTFCFFEYKYFQSAVLILTALLAINTLYKGYLHLKAVSPKEESDYETSYNNFSYLLSKIPDNEKDKVYYYEVVTSVYPLMGIDANYKYFVFQEWHGTIDPDIYNQISLMMKNEKPLWVITQPRGESADTYLSTYKNKGLADMIKNNYHLYEEKGPYLLYKLNGD